MGIYDEQIVSDPNDKITMEVSKTMMQAALANQTFDESGIEDTPVHRRVYEVTQYNVGILRKYGAMIDIPFANFMGPF